MEQIQLKARAIHCEGCVTSLQRVVGRLHGVLDVKGNAKEKTISVQFDPQRVSEEDIRGLMTQAGFPADR